MTTSPRRTLVFVSCSPTEEIVVFAFDRASATLTELGRHKVLPTGEPAPGGMPLVFSPDRRFLYAAIRRDPHSVVSLAVRGVDGDLGALGAAPLPERAACARDRPCRPASVRGVLWRALPQRQPDRRGRRGGTAAPGDRKPAAGAWHRDRSDGPPCLRRLHGRRCRARLSLRRSDRPARTKRRSTCRPRRRGPGRAISHSAERTASLCHHRAPRHRHRVHARSRRRPDAHRDRELPARHHHDPARPSSRRDRRGPPTSMCRQTAAFSMRAIGRPIRSAVPYRPDYRTPHADRQRARRADAALVRHRLRRQTSPLHRRGLPARSASMPSMRRPVP